MPDNELTVKIDAQTEDAVAAIDEVTDAIERLADALRKLEGEEFALETHTVGNQSITRLTTDSTGDWIDWDHTVDYDVSVGGSE